MAALEDAKENTWRKTNLDWVEGEDRPLSELGAEFEKRQRDFVSKITASLPERKILEESKLAPYPDGSKVVIVEDMGMARYMRRLKTGELVDIVN